MSRKLNFKEQNEAKKRLRLKMDHIQKNGLDLSKRYIVAGLITKNSLVRPWYIIKDGVSIRLGANTSKMVDEFMADNALEIKKHNDSIEKENK